MKEMKRQKTSDDYLVGGVRQLRGRLGLLLGILDQVLVVGEFTLHLLEPAIELADLASGVVHLDLRSADDDVDL